MDSGELESPRRRGGRWGLLLFFVLLAAGAGASYVLPEGWFFRRAAVPPGEQVAPPTAKPRAMRSVDLYFATEAYNALLPEAREIPRYEEPLPMLRRALEELLRGPAQARRAPTFPPGARVRALFLDGEGRAYVDFDKELVGALPGGARSELLTVYSLVNTLVLNFPEVRSVSLLLGGRPAESLKGHLSLKGELKPRMELVSPRARPAPPAAVPLPPPAIPPPSGATEKQTGAASPPASSY